jgi:hypothetical protein
MSFDFHVEVVIGPGESDYAGTADYAATAAKPNQAVTAQRVNVDPKCVTSHKQRGADFPAPSPFSRYPHAEGR